MDEPDLDLLYRCKCGRSSLVLRKVACPPEGYLVWLCLCGKGYLDCAGIRSLRLLDRARVALRQAVITALPQVARRLSGNLAVRQEVGDCVDQATREWVAELAAYEPGARQP